MGSNGSATQKAQFSFGVGFDISINFGYRHGRD